MIILIENVYSSIRFNFVVTLYKYFTGKGSRLSNIQNTGR